MSAHPSFFEIVGCGFVHEDVDEEFSFGFQGAGELGHQGLVVFHVFEELGVFSFVILVFFSWRAGS